MHACMHACMYVCMYVRTYVRMYVRMYERTYVCMYVCESEPLLKERAPTQKTCICPRRYLILLQRWSSLAGFWFLICIFLSCFFHINNIEKDLDGKFIIINLLINNNIPLLIVNLYGPNQDSPEWFEKLFEKINNYNMDHIIMVGDWNTSLTKLDTYNYNIQRNLKARNTINKFINEHNFVDIWSLQNKDQK